MAKMVLNSLSATADDDLYYNSVKTYLISKANAKIYKHKYDLDNEVGFLKRMALD